MITRRVLEQVEGLFRSMRQRVASLIARAKVTVVKDTAAIQTMQVEVHAGEFVEDAKNFQGYGFSSVPFRGAAAVVIFADGDRARPFVIGVDDGRYRPTGSELGEVVLYTDEGDQIRLGRGQVITLTAGTRINLGDDDAADPVARRSDLQIIKDGFDVHTHTTSATIGASAVVGVISPPLVSMPLPPGSGKVFTE